MITQSPFVVLYADDTQLFISFQPGIFAENISRLQAALGFIAD